MTRKNLIGDSIYMLIIITAIIIWKIADNEPLPWFGYLFIAVFGIAFIMFFRWLGYLMVVNNTQISLNEGEKLKIRLIAYQRSNPNRTGILFLTDRRLIFISSPPVLRKIIQEINLNKIIKTEIITKHFFDSKFIEITDNEGLKYCFALNKPEALLEMLALKDE